MEFNNNNNDNNNNDNNNNNNNNDNNNNNNNTNTNKKYNLVVCELFNKDIHGYSKESYDNVKGHYLCMHVSRNKSIFDARHDDDSDSSIDSEYNSNYESDEEDECHIHDITDLYSAFYINYSRRSTKEHDFIRNYKQIISNKNYIQPNIAEVIYLPSGECVAIIKTTWIRTVQRAWKRLLQQRKSIIMQRMRLNSLHYKSIHGTWPDHCKYLPSARGMFWR